MRTNGDSAAERPKRPLTEAQRALLDVIRNFIAEHSYPPTIREMGAILGHNSNAIAGKLQALQRKGWIRRMPHSARAITIL